MQNIYRFFLLISLAMSWSGPLFADSRNYFQILYDTSSPVVEGLRPDFGYAVYIHVDGKQILLDTGTDPDILEHNMKQAAVDVNALDMVVVSHNHHDHAGGLQRIRALNPDLPVLVPPGQHFPVKDVEVIEDHLKLTGNVYIIRAHTDKPTAGISDDLSIVLRGRSGAYVLSTCSHSGVAQILARAVEVSGDNVYYFGGGARLAHRPDSDTRLVASVLEQHRVQIVSPSHCSLSHRVDAAFKETIGERIAGSQLGAKIQLDLAE